MYRLLVFHQGNKVISKNLEENQEVIVGRSSNCDIQLETHPGISRKHFSLILKGGECILNVLSSQDTLILDNELARSGQFLTTENKLYLDPYTFTLKYSEEEAEVATRIQTQHETFALADEGNANLSEDLPIDGDNIQEHTQISDSPLFPELTRIDAFGQAISTFLLEGELWVIGRDSSATLVIDDVKMSRKHFKVTAVGDAFFIEDLGSSNGTSLNGHPLLAGQKKQLTSGDIISILDIRFRFLLIDPNFNERLEGALPSSAIEMPQNNSQSSSAFNSYEAQQGYLPPPEQPMLGLPYGGVNSADEEPKIVVFGKELPWRTEHKIRAFMGIIVFLLGAYLISEELNPPPPPEPPPEAEKPNLNDPYAGLTKEEKAELERSFQLALELFQNQKYELAKLELQKIKDKNISFPDLIDLEANIEKGIELLAEIEMNKKIQEEREKNEEIVQNTIKTCAKLIGPKVDLIELENCLQPALEINPEHSGIQELRAKASEIIEEKKRKEVEREAYLAKVKELEKMFNKAKALETKEPLKALPAFAKVRASKLPDPKNLKNEAKIRIENIEKKIKAAVDDALSSSKKKIEAGDLKGAIIDLESSYKFAPNDPLIESEVERLKNELRKKMQVFYQEAVVEENIGNVETAKERWRKILELDVKDGEYFQKSKMKLKKYGPI